MAIGFLKAVSVFIVLVGCFTVSTNAGFTEEDLIADAGELGRIKGANVTAVKQSVNGTGTPFIAFRGMRYAEAPIGERRFLPSIRATGPLNATGGIYDATSEGKRCIQPGPPETWLSEDCLNLNVYTPKPYSGNDSDLLPVIFYIHGGSFIIGQGNTYNGNRLMNRNVVLVSCNYRLGVLGFFSLNNEATPGNAAMYDIVNALNWTKEYIRYFGGDPNKITIAGQSAGAVAVTQLLVSPMARGLFQGAIANSGSALAAWGTTENPLEGSLKIAGLSGCYDSSIGPPNATIIEEISVCMRNATLPSLVIALYAYQLSERQQARLGFDVISPTVQSFNASASFQKFLPEHPKQVFEEGRQANVSLMMGTTRHDGSYVLGEYYNRFLKANNYVNDTEYLAQESVGQILKSLGIPNEYGVYDSIGKVYLGDKRKNGNFSEMYPGFIDLFSVFFFKASSYQTALYQSRISNNTYWYSFDFKGRQTMWESLFFGETPPFPGGITHGDEIMYLFYVVFGAFDNDEYAVSNRMLDYWANFATTGNPTPAASNLTTWPHLTIAEEKFISIGKDSVEQAYYDDTWSGAGWEVVPVPEEPTTTTEPTSSTPEETTPPTGPTTTPSNSTTGPTTPPVSSTTPTTTPTTTPPNSSTINSISHNLMIAMLFIKLFHLAIS